MSQSSNKTERVRKVRYPEKHAVRVHVGFLARGNTAQNLRRLYQTLVCNGACAVRAMSEAWYHVDRSADGLVFEGTLGVELLLGTRQTKVAHLHVALACDLSSVVSLVVSCRVVRCVVSQNALERTAREKGCQEENVGQNYVPTR
jgi:hypothetical protein